MTHPALYLPTGRIAFLPTRIVRAFNDNVAAGPLLTAADGADVAHNAPCAVLATSAAVPFIHEVPCAE
jgi:hypothetical protein